MRHVGGRHADGREEVFAFAPARDDRAIGNAVGLGGDAPDHAVADGVALFGDEVLHDVGVHAEGAEADGIGGAAFPFTVVLRHHVVGDHATGFADVDHPRPAAVVGEFILGQPVGADFLADGGGNARIVCERPEEAADVSLMFFFDFAAPRVAGFRVIPVGAGEIGADGVHVVPVDLGTLAGEWLD